MTEIRICSASPTVVLDIEAACQPQSPSIQSPIDDYYDAAESITLVGQPQLLSEYAVLGRLLLLGHVGAAETYIRTILVGLLNVCQLSRAHSGSQMIPFASIFYYGDTDVAHGLFDGTSLAGGPEIKKAVKKLTDIDLQGNGVLSDLLKRFDDLCQLRHAAVHAHGSIGTASAAALGLAEVGTRFSLDIDMARVHESAMVCRSVVQELNQFLFIKTFHRWRDSGILTRDYSLDEKLFVQLYELFRSRRDTADTGLEPEAAYETLLA